MTDCIRIIDRKNLKYCGCDIEIMGNKALCGELYNNIWDSQNRRLLCLKCYKLNKEVLK